MGLLQKRHLADFSLAVLCIFWGMSFIIMKLAIMEMDLFYFLFARFLLGVLILYGLFFKRLKNYNLKILKDGVILGTALFITFIFQIIGLKYTSASNSGFITGLHVVFVPIVLAFYFRRLPRATAFGGATLAAAGLFFLSVASDFTINLGDTLTIFCALFACFHIILTGVYAVRHDVYLLSLTQISTMVVLTGISALFFGTPPQSIHSLSPFVFLAIVLMGVFCTAFNFTVMTWAQQYTTPTRAATIYTLEPVFAAIFAFWWGGEVLGARGYLGAALIFLGIILSEFKSEDWGKELLIKKGEGG